MNGRHSEQPEAPTTDPVSHTPGPWLIVRDPRPDMEWNNSIAVAAAPHLEICSMFHHSEGWNDTDEANARLIAAAPDLLAALKFVRRLWAKDDKCAEIDVIDSAIAKAEGRP